MNCPENNNNKKNPVGGGSFRGSKNQKSGKFQELPRKSIHFFNPPPRVERGRGGQEGGDREGEREREAGREGGARAKPGNQLVHDKTIMQVSIGQLLLANVLGDV